MHGVGVGGRNGPRRCGCPSRGRRGWMRSAISPRLAIRTFSNMAVRACLLDDQERLAELHRLAVSTRICVTVPACGALIGFITFIASMISRVWPSATRSPTFTNGAAPGSGEEIGGADHRAKRRDLRPAHRQQRRGTAAGDGRGARRARRDRLAPVPPARDADALLVGSNSISVSPVSSRRPASLRTSASSISNLLMTSVFLGLLRIAAEGVQREQIADARRARRSRPWPPGWRRNGGGRLRGGRCWRGAPRSPAARRRSASSSAIEVWYSRPH